MTLDERAHWATVDVLDAVKRVRDARKRGEPDGVYVAALVSRYEELEAIRAAGGVDPSVERLEDPRVPRGRGRPPKRDAFLPLRASA